MLAEIRRNKFRGRKEQRYVHFRCCFFIPRGLRAVSWAIRLWEHILETGTDPGALELAHQCSGRTKTFAKYYRPFINPRTCKCIVPKRETVFYKKERELFERTRKPITWTFLKVILPLYFTGPRVSFLVKVTKRVE